MTIILNPFAPNCRHLPQKYTISTLQSVNIADNQNIHGCILKFSRFQRVKKVRRVTLFDKKLSDRRGPAPGPQVPSRGLCRRYALQK